MNLGAVCIFQGKLRCALTRTYPASSKVKEYAGELTFERSITSTIRLSKRVLLEAACEGGQSHLQTSASSTNKLQDKAVDTPIRTIILKKYCQSRPDGHHCCPQHQATSPLMFQRHEISDGLASLDQMSRPDSQV